jgi:hypothetical protein
MASPEQLLAYVHVTAVLQGLALDPARALRVAQHLARTAQLAALLEAVPLAPENEPAEIFKPAPFVPPVGRRGA